jgi:hypothetical protein
VVTGGIIGALGAVGTSKAEHILFGAAIGGLVGTAVGLVLGIVEGQRAWRRQARVAVTLAPTTTASGTLVWTPALVGRF